MKSQPKPGKKRILYIITQGTWGGAQKYVYDLATSLAGDFDVTVAIGEPEGKSNLQTRIADHLPHIRLIELKHLVRRISPLHDILAISELVKLYKQLKPDIVHLNSSKAGIIGSLAKLTTYNLQLTTVYTVHGWVFNEPLSWIRKNLYLLLEKFTNLWKDKLIVLSEQDKKTAINQLGVKQQKLSLIPIGINIPKYPFSKKDARNALLKHARKQIPTDSIWIGTIAGLYKTKGIDLLIEAIAQNKELRKLQFIIVGDGPEKKNLQLLITNYQLQNIYLLNFIENAPQYLPAFDLFVLPSRKEGLPYTLLEAKMAEVPIIATDVGGVSEIIENKKNGLLVPSKNIEKLAEALLFAYNNQDEMKELAKAGHRENFQKYSKKTMVENTTLLYLSLLRPPKQESD